MKFFKILAPITAAFVLASCNSDGGGLNRAEIPEGGDGGGQVVATGTPEQVADNPTSYTGQYLKKILSRSEA